MVGDGWYGLLSLLSLLLDFFAALICTCVDTVIPLRSTLTGLMYEKLMNMEDIIHLPKEVRHVSML